MSFIHHAIAKKIKEDKEKDRTVREIEGREILNLCSVPGA